MMKIVFGIIAVETGTGFGSNAVDFNGKVMQNGRKEAIEAWNRRAEDGK